MGKKTYFIVKLKCKYNDTNNFKIVDKDAWLGYTTEGGGFYQIYNHQEWAHKFDKKPTREFVMSQSGRPWYYKILDYEIFEVTETFKQEIVKVSR